MGFVICGGNGSELIFVAVLADPSRLPALHNALASTPNYLRSCSKLRSPRPPRSEIAIFQRFSVLVRFVVCGGNGSELIFVAVMAYPSRLPALHKALASDAQLLAVL